MEMKKPTWDEDRDDDDDDDKVALENTQILSRRRIPTKSELVSFISLVYKINK